jgi:ubiquinone/menaquinone biosynthesis C-methylase UbiE
MEHQEELRISGRNLARECADEFDQLAIIFDELPIAAGDGPDRVLALRPMRQSRALDVGCGTGNTVAALAGCFKSVVGIDLSSKMLGIASAKLRQASVRNATLARMDGSGLAFADASFDFVVSHTALHHWGDPGAVLWELRRVVSPGGRIVVIDIVGPSIISPALKMQFVSVLDLVRSVSWGKIARGIRRFRAANHAAWQSHLRKEKFYTPTSFETVVRTILPEARMHYNRREFLMTKYVTMCWDKPLA